MPHSKGKRLLSMLLAGLFLATAGMIPTIYAEELTTPGTQQSESASYTALKYGLKDNDEVKAMQRRLKELGYVSCSATGNYFDETREGVKKFLTACGMEGNGKEASSEMLAILYSSAAPAYGSQLEQDSTTTSAPTATPTPAPTTAPTVGSSSLSELEYGDKSDAIKAMQKRLKELGYMSCDATGSYYDLTVRAVKAFLKAVGLEGNGKTATVEMLTILYSDSAPAEGETYATPAPTATATPTPTPTPAPTPTPVTYQTLEKGDKSDAIEQMQERLKELGYLNCKPTGGYYDLTVKAVKAFLEAIGMEGNGKTATPDMQAVLYSSYAPAKGETYVPAPTATPEPTAAPSEYVTLKQGDISSEVKLVQRRLKELGYISSSVTGGYYSATSAGIRLFLAAVGIEGDGRTLTPEMQEILFSDEAPAVGEIYAPSATQTPSADTTATPEPTADPALTYVTLVYCETSQGVYAMQEQLIYLGYLDSSPTGGYFDQTVKAVKDFLEANGMQGDGKTATPEMQALLFSITVDNSVDYSDAQTDIVLSKGDQSAQVALLILRLSELGYYSGDSVDKYDDGVREAVRWFQNSNKLSVDGVAGPKTLTKLYSDGVVSAEDTTTGNESAPDSEGSVSGEAVKPTLSTVVAADWNDDYYFNVSSGLFKKGAVATVTDVATGISFQVMRVGGYNHADVEPLTAYDTQQMYRCYNGTWSWSRRAVYVTIGGVTIAGSMNGMPHPDEHIADNGMDGHTCIHFSGSMTHGSSKVDPDHQAAVNEALNADKDAVQDKVNAQQG